MQQVNQMQLTFGGALETWAAENEALVPHFRLFVQPREEGGNTMTR